MLALVTKDDDRSCKVSFMKVIKPQLTANEMLTRSSLGLRGEITALMMK